MRRLLVFPAMALLACASGPAPTAPAPAATPRPSPQAIQTPAPEELPVGAAAARISGPVPAFTDACQEAMARARAGLATVKAAPAPRNTGATLTGYDDALAAINDLDAQAELARNASPDPAMRKAAEDCDREIQTLSTAINQDRALYDVLSALDLSGQDGATVYWIKRDLREFRRLGVDRDEETRKKVRALSDEMVTIGQEFDRNIREGAKKVPFAPAELAGLPEDFRKAHPPGTDGQVLLSTDYPDYHPFMAYARVAKARERFWRANNTRAPANAEVLPRLLAKRYELATLLGYANWADYTTENKMIGSGKTASEFVDRISAAAARALQGRAGALARPQAEGSARSDPVRGLGLRVLPGPGEGRAVPLRCQGGPAILRGRPRAPGGPETCQGGCST